MEQDERDFILNSAARLKEWENTPRNFDDPFSDMTREELSKMLALMLDMMRQRDRLVEELRSLIEQEKENTRLEKEKNKQLHEKMDKVMGKLEGMMQAFTALGNENAELRKLLAEAYEAIKAKDEQLKLGRKSRFGSKSQKGSQANNN